MSLSVVVLVDGAEEAVVWGAVAGSLVAASWFDGTGAGTSLDEPGAVS
jgi:hypothetical protein